MHSLYIIIFHAQNSTQQKMKEYKEISEFAVLTLIKKKKKTIKRKKWSPNIRQKSNKYLKNFKCPIP